jgi:hypothetical protein
MCKYKVFKPFYLKIRLKIGISLIELSSYRKFENKIFFTVEQSRYETSKGREWKKEYEKNGKECVYAWEKGWNNF